MRHYECTHDRRDGSACISLLLLLVAGSFFGTLGALRFSSSGDPVLLAQSRSLLLSESGLVLQAGVFLAAVSVLRLLGRPRLLYPLFFLRGFLSAYCLVLLRQSSGGRLYLIVCLVCVTAAFLVCDRPGPAAV